MLPIPGRPGFAQSSPETIINISDIELLKGTMQPDVAIMKHNRLTQMNVLTRSLEYRRVPLDATIDFETQTLYILLGEPADDGRVLFNFVFVIP